jgi:hypothetical protein
VTQIPASALSSSLTPLQRQQNDALRARQVQSAKAARHNEDVEELDDTGVDSIRDEQQNGGNQQQFDDNPRKEAEDKVEIQNLEIAPVTPLAPRLTKPPSSQISHLDISA